MGCSADDLAVWKDFPKGLRVLLLDGDATSAAEAKLKLEAMDYIVFSYFNENEAMEAISKKTENFHVAIVEVTSGNTGGRFRCLEMAKDLPTIAISDVQCLNTMMKCIALGAAEFLQKPLSEEKLRNIWQHVVHKAFNAGGDCISKSLQPIKETVVSMLQLESENVELKVEIPTEMETMDRGEESRPDTSEENDKIPAPSTPQLIKVGRSMDDGCCQDPPNCLKDEVTSNNSIDLIEVRENSHSESKHIDNTINSLPNLVDILKSNNTEDEAEEEVISDSGYKTDGYSSIKESCQPCLSMHRGDIVDSSAEDDKKKKSSVYSLHSQGNRSNKRKMKVDWTPDLHRKFVKAVEQLGIDQAIPSKILDLMKVEGITRHNIASHLQKYRMHRRHILPKDDHKRWQPHGDSHPRGYMQKPMTVLPPLRSSSFLPSPGYPFWGHPRSYTAQVWGHTGFPAWHPPQGSWLWKSNPTILAEAWGCPVGPPYSQFGIPAQSTTLSNGLNTSAGGNNVSNDSYDFNLADEVIDEAVKEAMNKPWIPLPLGLKPPPIDAVLVELQNQGIRTFPPSAPHN